MPTYPQANPYILNAGDITIAFRSYSFIFELKKNPDFFYLSESQQLHILEAVAISEMQDKRLPTLSPTLLQETKVDTFKNRLIMKLDQATEASLHEKMPLSEDEQMRLSTIFNHNMHTLKDAGYMRKDAAPSDDFTIADLHVENAEIFAERVSKVYSNFLEEIRYSD